LAAVAFALLPAVESGWQENLRNLRVAFGGVGNLFGLPAVAGPQANIEAVDAVFSVSITSALARAHSLAMPVWAVTLGAIALFSLAGRVPRDFALANEQSLWRVLKLDRVFERNDVPGRCLIDPSTSATSMVGFPLPVGPLRSTSQLGSWQRSMKLGCKFVVSIVGTVGDSNRTASPISRDVAKILIRQRTLAMFLARSAEPS
jgi:hypothetical protein